MKGLLFFWLAACIVCSIVFAGKYLYEKDPLIYRYEGKEIFTTQKDYQAFKEFIAQKGIEIEYVKSLASEPPIIVTYKIKMPYDWKMPYFYYNTSETLGPNQYVGLAVWSAGSVLGLVVLILIAAKLWGKEES